MPGILKISEIFCQIPPTAHYSPTTQTARPETEASLNSRNQGQDHRSTLRFQRNGAPNWAFANHQILAVFIKEIVVHQLKLNQFVSFFWTKKLLSNEVSWRITTRHVFVGATFSANCFLEQKQSKKRTKFMILREQQDAHLDFKKTPPCPVYHRSPVAFHHLQQGVDAVVRPLKHLPNRKGTEKVVQSPPSKLSFPPFASSTLTSVFSCSFFTSGVMRLKVQRMCCEMQRKKHMAQLKVK